MQAYIAPKELAGYRVWLNELEEEARGPGGNLGKCDEDIWDIFSPDTPTGSLIYQKYTDEELLWLLARRMNFPDQPPPAEDIYVIHQVYLERRFGSLQRARSMAVQRYESLKAQLDIPPDWWKRVSVQPVIEYCARKERKLPPEDLEFLEQLCTQVYEARLPPYISIKIRKRLNRISNFSYILQLMGIPYFRKSRWELMKWCWELERQNV